MREQAVVPTQTRLPSLRIATFGPFTLQRRISSREEPPQFLTLEGKALGDRPGTLLTLLKFLLCSPNRHATKAALMEELWPGVDEESAQRRLSTAKSVLGKLLRTAEGTNLLLETPDGQGVYLAPQSEIEVDADAFEAAIHEASLAEQTSSPDHLLLLWQHAYDLRRGDYLPDDVGASWTEPRRLSLETLYALCVQQLASLYLRREQPIEAERILRAYWSTHLTDEEVLAQLMELLASRGKRLAALRCYKISARALRDELDVAPSEPLRVLAEQLRKHGFSQSIVATTGQTALELWSSPLNFLLPEPLVTSWPQTTEGVGAIIALGERVAQIMQEVTRWHGRALYCDQLQKLLHLELERWNDMAQSSDHDMLISRRAVLASIAALPVAVSVAILRGQRSPIVLETFLPECTASITVCRQLMNSNGISIVAEQLPKYLPALEMLAQQPSRYQKIAARLAAQGCLLMALVALHHLKFALKETYCHRAVTFSAIAEDQTLHVMALAQLADAFYYENKPGKLLRVYEQVISIISQPNNKVAPLIQSRAFVQAAASYAQAGQVQNALYCAGKAHEVFPEHLENDEPVYFSTEHGMSLMLLWEGTAYGHLGKFALDRMMPRRSKVLYTQAQNTFAKLEQIDPAITVPERLRVEIINLQAATAIAQGDVELFSAYLQAGVQGAKALGSDKRMQEAIANWRTARQRWPHEQHVLELAEVLL